MVTLGYKQTEIGVIPEDWADKKLGDVGKVCMCKRIFADQTSDTGEIPFFKIGTFGKEADAYISRELYEDFKRRFSYPQKGDVLISAAGTLGRSVVFDGKDSYFQDSNIVWLDLDKEQLCNEYLYHYYKVIQWASSEGSTIARLYNGIICNTHIAVPDVEEQKKIATVLSEVDELISLTEKQLSKKKAIKQGAMQELLTGKKRLPGFSEKWESNKLHKCTERIIVALLCLGVLAIVIAIQDPDAFKDYFKSPIAEENTFSDYSILETSSVSTDFSSENETVFSDSYASMQETHIEPEPTYAVQDVQSNYGTTFNTLPTEPVVPEPPSSSVMGYVIESSGGLKIRSGPGTSYQEVGRLAPNEQVTIYEQIYIRPIVIGLATSVTQYYRERGKAMHDHGLFQAICRVNRLDGESKEFGYIVDYKELFGDLADAVNKYTAGAFEAYDEEDVEGLLKDRTIEAKKHFEGILEELDELCEGVEYPRGKLEYQHYFCGESGQDEDKDEAFARLREKLYKLVGRLIRAFAELKPRMNDAGYSAVEQEKLDKRVSFYIALRDEIGRASGDFIDLKAYEPGMRYLIDNYIAAEDSQKIGMLDDFTLLDFILSQEGKLDNEDDTAGQESAAESIENNIRKKVVERMVINPAYYARMSAILEQLIIDRKKGVIKYAELLNTYVELAKNATKPEDNTHYPESIRSHGGLRALYDNCGEDEAYALKLHKAIIKAKQDGFRNNPVKENRIKQALYKITCDEDEVERIYRIVVEQEEY